MHGGNNGPALRRSSLTPASTVCRYCTMPCAMTLLWHWPSRSLWSGATCGVADIDRSVWQYQICSHTRWMSDSLLALHSHPLRESSFGANLHCVNNPKAMPTCLPVGEVKTPDSRAISPWLRCRLYNVHVARADTRYSANYPVPGISHQPIPLCVASAPACLVYRHRKTCSDWFLSLLRVLSNQVGAPRCHCRAPAELGIS